MQPNRTYFHTLMETSTSIQKTKENAKSYTATPRRGGEQRYENRRGELFSVGASLKSSFEANRGWLESRTHAQRLEKRRAGGERLTTGRSAAESRALNEL